MSNGIYFYQDKQGKITNNIIEIVTQEVEILSYTYVEKHGKAPTKEMVDKWVYNSLKSMGWYDDDE